MSVASADQWFIWGGGEGEQAGSSSPNSTFFVRALTFLLGGFRSNLPGSHLRSIHPQLEAAG